MKKHTTKINSPSRRAIRFLFNLFLALFMLISVTGVSFAASYHPQSSGERFAEDPYDLWQGEFLDFAPPSPDLLQLQQPDGTTLEARLTPMETGGQIETLDGYTIVQDEQEWWTYAQNDDGVTNPSGKVVPSSLKVGKDLPYGLTKKVGQTKSVWLNDKGNDKRDEVFEAVRKVQSPNNSIFTAGDVEPKRYRYVVILVQYQDVKFEPYQTREWFQERISGLGTSPTGSVTDLYFENSYGHFIPELDVYGPVTSSYDMAKFDYQLSGGWSVSRAISNEIGDLVKDMVPWDEYDNDRVVYTSRGEEYRSVDMVVLLHAGPGKEATGIDGQIWSHASTANFRTGYFGEDDRELRIRASNTCPAIGFNIGVTAHEMGHSIGESDYYATSYNNAGSGDWEIMAGGSWMGDNPAGSNPMHFNPFSKVNQGWVETQVITDTTYGVELWPRSLAPTIVEIPLGGSGSSSIGAEERLYIEYVSNRAPGAIFDKAAHGSGLLIWHYDRGGSQNNPARLRMAVVEYDFRDGTQELRLNLNRGEPTDPWTDTTLGITPFTEPNTNRNTPLDGTTISGWHFMNISQLGQTMTFDAIRADGVTTKLGIDRPAFAQQPVIAGTGPAMFTTLLYNLTSDPLAGVKVEFIATLDGQQVKVAESTITTLDPGVPTTVSAVWDQPVSGKFAVQAKASHTGDEASAEGVVRVFSRTASVLVVDDDDGYTAEEAFEGVLTSLGVPYVLVDRTDDVDFSLYDLIIWSAGQAGRQNGQLNPDQRTALKAYLDAGGKLLMSSPRLAAALAATGSAAGVDPTMLRDYFGSAYPMSSQMGGGEIYGLGHPIGGFGTFQLRAFPGRDIQDYLQPAESQIGSVSPLFTWSFGDYLGMEVIGDEVHNNFKVVYFGFNFSQVISGNDRLTLAQQVLDQFGISFTYFDKSTYLMQKSGAVKLTLHDFGASSPQAFVTSDAQPEGVMIALSPEGSPGTFTGILNVQKTASNGGTLKVNDVDTLMVQYQDSLGHDIWSSAAVLLKVDNDLPAVIHHDLISKATDAQDLPVLAVVTDDIRVQKVELFYRVAGNTKFIRVPMQENHRQGYTAVIPASAVTPLGVEYYIVARDSEDNMTYKASEGIPAYIVVQPRTLGMQ
ncbi:MAG: M6 family metalloprotease domain-containing protein [Anaerolineales bacterium]|jgi:M6 family metalloprotease-like protein